MLQSGQSDVVALALDGHPESPSLDTATATGPLIQVSRGDLKLVLFTYSGLIDLRFGYSILF